MVSRAWVQLSAKVSCLKCSAEVQIRRPSEIGCCAPPSSAPNQPMGTTCTLKARRKHAKRSWLRDVSRIDVESR